MYANEESAGEARVLQFCSGIIHQRGVGMKKDTYESKNQIENKHFFGII